MLSPAALEQLVESGAVDTVIVAFTDMQGRLVGKRMSAGLFIEEVAAHGAECCSYLLAVDVDMNTVSGYAMSSWDTGYGDMVMRPDLSTLRLLPWLPNTALVIADLGWADGGEVAVAPRAILRRQLDRLGKVNPLALEEFEALTERHNFLATQLEDLRKTRRDLLTVVKEVDDRVQEVFASAYADTAREFEHLFSRLFPGGQGNLVLTEPDDMLATGIEIEARPPGKKVKRLSLLSGGERSLTAIAYLFAIFKARPSPFYVLDEVEAALDDTNLRRLLALFEQLRARSQILIITHQKPTMEVADALYGVTMQGDGITAVISQRMRGQQVEQLVSSSS